MKYSHAFVAMIFTVILFSCKKHNEYIPPTSEQNKKILLKEVFFAPDASPYYHFEYNMQGMLTKAIYAGSAYNYDVIYSGTRISELKSNSTLDKDRLQYVYDNAGKVTVINIVDEGGVLTRRSTFSYTGSQLTGILSEQKQGNDFVTERTMAFAYLPDGNVGQIDDHVFPVGIQPEIISTTQFDQYDDKISPDGFSLLYDLRDHLFLLPGVHLNKNNPCKLIHTGTNPNFTLNLTYTYNSNNAPSGRTADGIVTTGPNTGERIDQQVVYTYY